MPLSAVLPRMSALLAVLLLPLVLVASGCSSAEKWERRTPVLNSTSPENGARNVPLNSMLSVDFDRPMRPLTDANFTVRQGSRPVPGRVSTSADGSSATFQPASLLSPNSTYTAVVSRDAASNTGSALGADRTWSFSTGLGSDIAAPRVISAFPATGSHGVATNARLVVTFDKAIDPFSVSPATFVLMSDSTSVSGTVAYGPGASATFTPSTALQPLCLYTVNVSTAVKDLQGNRLASPMTWTFTTGSAASEGPTSVSLGSALNYTILARAGISSVGPSVVTGDLGLSPAASSNYSGFGQSTAEGDGFATSAQVRGKIYCVDAAAPGPADLATAIRSMESAYSDCAARRDADRVDIGDGNIGGMTLKPGLYRWDSTLTVPTGVTLEGGARDIWIFQTTGDLFVSSAKRITLTGGAQARNIYWQVAGQTIIGPGAHFEGILLGKGGVTLVTGATMNGRIFSQAQVDLQQATVTAPPAAE